MLSIEADVLARHPGVSAVAVVIENLEPVVAGLTAERLDGLWRRAAKGLSDASVTMETLVDHPALRPWRDATRAAGLKPANFRSSVEAVTRRVLKEGKLSTPLALVDAYCAVSVLHQAPLGAYDLARLSGAAITLRLARPATDRFVPLGAPPDQMPLTAQVVVYASGDTILCWNFNHRDSAETSLLASTSRAVFVSEALDEAGSLRSRAALEEMCAIAREFGAMAGTVVHEPS